MAKKFPTDPQERLEKLRKADYDERLLKLGPPPDKFYPMVRRWKIHPKAHPNSIAALTSGRIGEWPRCVREGCKQVRMKESKQGCCQYHGDGKYLMLVRRWRKGDIKASPLKKARFFQTMLREDSLPPGLIETEVMRKLMRELYRLKTLARDKTLTLKEQRAEWSRVQHIEILGYQFTLAWTEMELDANNRDLWDLCVRQVHDWGLE